MTSDKPIYQHRGIDHEDERRAIATAFNGDFGGFIAKQVKAYDVHQDCQLAGHFHKYDELFYILSGEVTVLFLNTKTSEKGFQTLKEKDSFLVPAFFAHKVFVKKGTVFIGCTEEPFISSELNDVKYDF